MNFDNFLKDSQRFEGDLALFWAGRMSMVAQNLYVCTAIDLTPMLSLLKQCSDMYDSIIYGRRNEQGTFTFKTSQCHR